MRGECYNVVTSRRICDDLQMFHPACTWHTDRTNPPAPASRANQRQSQMKSNEMNDLRAPALSWHVDKTGGGSTTIRQLSP